eukprot:3505626-Pyramimonas_sp.AAC.1
MARVRSCVTGGGGWARTSRAGVEVTPATEAHVGECEPDPEACLSADSTVEELDTLASPPLVQQGNIPARPACDYWLIGPARACASAHYAVTPAGSATGDQGSTQTRVAREKSSAGGSTSTM